MPDAGGTTQDAAGRVDPGPCSFSGVLATWNLSAEPGSQSATDTSSTATGVMAAPLARAPSLTAMAGAGSINAANWSTAVEDPTRYYTLAITAPSGCLVDVHAMSIDTKASSMGPSSASVATSADAFAHATSIAANAVSTPSLAVTGQSGTLEIRIYGFDAGAASGTMRLENTLTVSGALH